MKIEHDSADKNTSYAPTFDELKDLERLQAVIEQAVADGKITAAEMAAIKAQVWADGKITSHELSLYTKLILQKIRAGELMWEF